MLKVLNINLSPANFGSIGRHHKYANKKQNLLIKIQNHHLMGEINLSPWLIQLLRKYIAVA